MPAAMTSTHTHIFTKRRKFANNKSPKLLLWILYLYHSCIASTSQSTLLYRIHLNHVPLRSNATKSRLFANLAHPAAYAQTFPSHPCKLNKHFETHYFRDEARIYYIYALAAYFNFKLFSIVGVGKFTGINELFNTHTNPMREQCQNERILIFQMVFLAKSNNRLVEMLLVPE